MRRGRVATSRSPSPIIEESEGEAEMLAELSAAPTRDVELLQPASWISIWGKRASALWRLIRSRSLLPDSLRHHPYTMPVLLGIFLLLLLLPLRLYFILVMVGVVIGYVYAVPEALIRPKSGAENPLLELLLAPLKLVEKSEKLSMAKLEISPAIDDELDALLDDVLGEIVNTWYVPLCKSAETEFQSCVRSTINAAIMNLVRFGSTRNKDMSTLMLYGITNALIVHMEEYRSFEGSKLSLDHFIASGRSRRTHHRTYLDELEHLRQISGLLLKKLLPKQESRSILVNSLLKELVSGNALAGLVDRLADPDFINEQIIKHMQDPAETLPTVEAGWNMVVLKVLRGKNLPSDVSTSGLYLVIHIAGRRVKTRRIRDANQLWNEVFRFKLSDAVKGSLKVYVQLCQFNYMGQDQSLGYSKLVPDFDNNPFSPTPVWLKFVLKSGIDQPVNRAAIAPEVLVEVTTIIGGVRRSIETSSGHVIVEDHSGHVMAGDRGERVIVGDHGERIIVGNHSERIIVGDRGERLATADDELLFPTREGETPSPVTAGTAETLSAVSSYAQPMDAPDHGVISLEAALQNNELFMEFLEYLNTVKAPPYLQFMMNVDALRQFAAMSLGIDSKESSAIDAYFRKGILSETQLEQLKMIKHDAADVFSTHFSDNARYRIPLDPGMQQELQEWVNRSDRVNEQGHYAGGPVGPSIFVPAYKWVANVLEEVYFPKFKSSEAFNRFMDRAQFATLNFTVEDDRMSIYSQDSSAVPSNWVYSDQTYVERQALSAGGRSRTSSLDNLDDMKEYEMPEPGTDVKKIAAEISISRQKMVLIEEQIEKLKQVHGPSDAASAIKSLRKERKALDTHVRNLIGLLEEKEESVGSERDDLWIDLSNAAVKVTLIQRENVPDENMLSSLWSSTMGSVITAVSDSLFEIEIRCAPVNDTEEGPTMSVVRRSYAEFGRLQRRLIKQFPKVGKIPFPDQGVLSSGGVDKSLQTYLEMLISDEFVRQSNVLREFMTLDGDAASERSTAGQFMEAIVGKKVKDVLNSATHILSGSPSASEERRSRFYETRERHTSVDVTDTRRGPAPAFHSVIELPTSSQSPARPVSAAPSPLLETVPAAEGSPRKRVEAAKTPTSALKESLRRMPSVELPPTPPRRSSVARASGHGPHSKVTIIDELTDAEIEMLVETFFAFVIETFDLREPNQWLRRKLLGVFKQLLKQAYGDTLNKVLTNAINSAFSEEAILKYIHEARQALFPEGVFIGRRPPPQPRSEDQKFATMVEARTVFLRHTPDFVQNMAGRYNAVCGMTRIFHALQHKALNKTLVYASFDIILKLFFSERPTQ